MVILEENQPTLTGSTTPKFTWNWNDSTGICWNVFQLVFSYCTSATWSILLGVNVVIVQGGGGPSSLQHTASCPHFVTKWPLLTPSLRRAALFPVLTYLLSSGRRGRRQYQRHHSMFGVIELYSPVIKREREKKN